MRDTMLHVYLGGAKTKKERYVPPFYRWCAGVLIGIVCIGTVWMGMRWKRRGRG